MIARMLPEHRIRPATNADLDDILAIEARWPTTPHWTRPQFEKELDSERSCFAALERAGKVCGYAAAWKVLSEAQLLTVAVKPEEAGKGLGRALLKHVIEAAKEWGCEKVTLEVSAQNAPALRLYASSGFKVVGRRPKFYNDGSDAILMDLALP